MHYQSVIVKRKLKVDLLGESRGTNAKIIAVISLNPHFTELPWKLEQKLSKCLFERHRDLVGALEHVPASFDEGSSSKRNHVSTYPVWEK